MRPLVTIQVCIGSGCHLKGANAVINKLKELVAMNRADVDIKLTASFCQGHCTHGVVVRFDNDVITGVSPDNVAAIFAEKVLAQA
mgnify:CR=1 FL=1